MAEIINLHTRERTKLSEPSHRDAEGIFSDDDWAELCDMMTWAERYEIELFIMEIVSRD